MLNILIVLLAQTAAPAMQALPVLSLPDPALDDTLAYEGYRTRFLRDARGNTLQIYVRESDGRVVHLWANAANESLGFSARDSAGRPARLEWASAGATLHDARPMHGVEYRLRTPSSRIEIGHLLLGSMRIERDLQYQRGHLRPFGGPTFEVGELAALIEALERLDTPEQRRHLALLSASAPADLRARLQPVITTTRTDTSVVVRAEQPSFDARNRLVLEIGVDPRAADLEIEGNTLRLRSRSAEPLELVVRVATDAAALTPLSREEIFNREFLEFYERVRAAAEAPARLAYAPAGDSVRLRFRRLERQVRSVELLSTREKLMAGLPNFATYFGRDMMVTALLMEPVWSATMLESVLAGVLRKLSPDGQVSHEEALGGQAVREYAAAYAGLVGGSLTAREAGQTARADTLLESARALLARLQDVRENYHMRDDEFQLPILAALYLDDPRITAERKRDFLLEAAGGGDGTRMELLLSNLGLVAEMTAPYARAPRASNLIEFPRRPEGGWFPGSWRDSNAGYANGRFAMDINVVWAPQALRSTERILAALGRIGIDAARLQALAPGHRDRVLGAFLRDPALLQRTVRSWSETAEHFEVALGPRETAERIRAKLEWLPPAERAYWSAAAQASGGGDSLRFLALALDSVGRPLPVVNTDPAMWLFLDQATEHVLSGRMRAGAVLDRIRPLVLPYPRGLFVEGLGSLVANDAYAEPEVWQRFHDDDYHAPRVVWGREVNLLLSGLARQIGAAFDASGKLRDPATRAYVAELVHALERVHAAVTASGFEDSELWSYRIRDSELLPVRYGTSSDLQLWSLTDLAVQFLLERTPRLRRGG